MYLSRQTRRCPNPAGSLGGTADMIVQGPFEAVVIYDEFL